MADVPATLSFCVAASGPNLRLIVRLDDSVIYEACPVAEPSAVAYEFNDDKEDNHVLSFEMLDKLPDHTTINEDGEILQDRCVTITDIAFDGIQLGHIVTEVAQYYHDTNSTKEPVIDRFYGVMGCNGRVEIPFSTPIYLWLLENM